MSLRLRHLLALLSFLICCCTLSFGQVRTGIYRGRLVTYTQEKNRAVYEGDILLDRVQKITAGASGDAGVIAYPAGLWPKVGSVFQVPYIIDPASGGVSNINSAVSQFNSTFSGLIQWVPRTSETDYVDFNLDPNNFNGQCESYVGRVGGEQVVGGSAVCAVSTLLHEMGHVIGMWHEQSRSDRDAFVTVLYDNVIKGSRSNFDQVLDNVQNVTLYDYASVMHYIPFAFSRNGGPTLESIPAGIPLSNLVGYTASDIDGIKRLYGAPPTAVTVTSNPPGLQVIVDGATVTTPQSFSWSLNSTHSVDLPPGPQTVSGVTYTYGRWNDNTAASHPITALPGNGEVAFPASSPAVTVYSANFVKLVPYAVSIFPTGTGSVTPAPAPLSYPPAAGVFFVARQQVTLTSSPNAGQNFYALINSPFWLPGGLSANPKIFYVMDDGTAINTTALFTSSPVYTVGANPAASNLYVFVDNGFWYGPKSFALPYDSTWTVGSSHSLNIDSLELPFSINSRYRFSSWSDGGAQNHNVTLSSSNTAYTANVTPEFVAASYSLEGCGGTVLISPASPTGDGFYPTGQLLSFSQTPNSGWIFTGWLYDLSGTGNPQSLTVADEILVAADYDTTNAPLSLTSLSPAAAVAGGGNFSLSINGTGFTASTLVFVNGVFRAATLVNSGTLSVVMTAADIATPGAFQIFVENFPSGALCAAIAAKPFFVANHPIVTPTPPAFAFPAQIVGTTSPAKAITLKNNGTTAVTVSSITASGNFAQTNNCPGSLLAAASCRVNVTFTPTTAGAISGAVTVSDTAPDSPQVVALSGTAITPVTMAPASLAFGTVPVGNTSPAKLVTLTNNQSAVLTFSFAASGNYAAVGSGANPCVTSLAAKAKCTMSVTFKPTASGAISGAVTVTHNAAFSPQEVAASGTGSGGGTSPLTFNPASVSFPNQVVGTSSAAKVVTVKNVSAGSLTISSIAASGNYTAVGAGPKPCGGALAAAASCTMTVTFSPSLAGKIVGAVAITDTATVNQQVLNLQGTAVLPLSFAPVSLTFAAQTVATTSASQTVTMTNNQATTLTINSIGGSGDFTAVAGGASPCGSTLIAHGQCTFTVAFTPSAVGTIKGAATVSHSAANSPQVVGLAGTGQ